MKPPVVIALLSMTCEMSIYVAYYKDVVFGIVAIFVKVGIYFHMDFFQSKIINPELVYLEITVITLTIIDIVFILVTFAHSFQ